MGQILFLYLMVQQTQINPCSVNKVCSEICVGSHFSMHAGMLDNRYFIKYNIAHRFASVHRKKLRVYVEILIIRLAFILGLLTTFKSGARSNDFELVSA